MIAFTFVDEPGADRDEIAAERWTLGLLGGYLKEMYPPQEPAWSGMIGSLTGFPLVVDDDLPMCEVRVRRRPPVDLGDLAAMIREFTVTAPAPTGASADWCACTIFKQGAGLACAGMPPGAGGQSCDQHRRCGQIKGVAVSARSIDELAQVVRQRLAADEDAANWADSGPWWIEQEDVKYWGHEPAAPRLVGPGGTMAVIDGSNPLNGEHAARHDPRRVLANVRRDRRLLDLLLAEKHSAADSGVRYRPCAALADLADPCDCGRDERVRGYLELMAGADETEAS